MGMHTGSWALVLCLCVWFTTTGSHNVKTVHSYLTSSWWISMKFLSMLLLRCHNNNECPWFDFNNSTASQSCPGSVKQIKLIQLTHWGWDGMPDFSQTTFSKPLFFLNVYTQVNSYNFRGICPWVSNWQLVIIIPPPNEVGGGILDSPCPSVRLSIRPSVDDMVSGA